MRTLFNLLWSITLGLILWVMYMSLSFLFSLTLVLNPIGKSMREIAKIILWPFGKSIIRDKNQSAYDKNFGRIFNTIWFIPGLIFSLIHIIFGIIACITIVGIPTGIVLFKIAKAIVFPIGIKVVNQKQLVQEMVREELKKQGNLNQNQQVNNLEEVNISNTEKLTIEDKSRLYDEMMNQNNKQIPLKKGNTSVSMEEALKPFMFLKPILIVLIFGFQLLFSFFIIDEISIVLGILFLILSIIQIFIYITIKFNLLNIFLNFISSKNMKYIFGKVNLELLFLLTSLLIVIGINISYLIYIIYSTITGNFSLDLIWFLMGINLGLILHQFIFIKFSYKKLGEIDGILSELDKFQDLDLIKKIRSILELKVKPILIEKKS